MSEEDIREEIEVMRRMVATSRRDRAVHGDIYVMWGFVVLLGTAVESVAIAMDWSIVWIGWPILGVLGGVYAGFSGARKERESSVLTYASKIEAQAWMYVSAAVVGVAFVGGATGIVPHTLISPIISMMIGAGVGVAGALYEDKLLRLAGVAFIVGGSVSLFLDRPFPQIIFCTLTVFGYILPGLRMMKRERGSP